MLTDWREAHASATESYSTSTSACSAYAINTSRRFVATATLVAIRPAGVDCIYLGGYLMGERQMLLCVEFPVPGHPDYARAESTIRDRVLSELKHRDFGTMVGAGSGQGWLGFRFQVKDSIEARRILANVMAYSMPNQSYKVTEIDEKTFCPTSH